MSIFSQISTKGDALPTRTNQGSVVFQNKLYIVMGQGDDAPLGFDDIYCTEDGITWKKLEGVVDENGNAMPVNRIPELCVHNNKVYMMGGVNNAGVRLNTVYVTMDMIHWKRLNNASWTARYAFGLVSFLGRLWVMGGDDGSKKQDVWWSKDGVSWTQESDAPWLIRSSFAAIVHNNRIYISGGNLFDSEADDVWSTIDGRNWVQDTSGGQFAVKSSHAMCSVGDRIVMAGGYNNQELWYSVDGKTWRQGTATMETGEIRKFTMVVLNNKVLIAFGYDNTGGYKNGVWQAKTEEMFRIK